MLVQGEKYKLPIMDGQKYIGNVDREYINLFLAAPEMLALLEKISKAAFSDDIWREVDSVIKKAKGEI